VATVKESEHWSQERVMVIRTSAARPPLILIVVLALVALLAALAPTASAGDRHRPHYTVDWAPCAQSPHAQCGTLEVPIDWSRPRGPKVSLAVARRPASDPSRRIGTLFFNPGGPGDGAVSYIAQAEAIFSPTLLARFDIAGMDPRGMLGSHQISCEDRPVIRPETNLWPTSAHEFTAMLANNRAVGLACLRDTGELMRHTDTVNVARDHEALRLALRERTVSWLGLSYGTQVAGNYAELYPRRTRAMVLDAAMDHSLSEVEQVAGEMLTAEDSFNRFLAWCPTSPDCALRGQDVAAVFDRLVANADRRPIAVRGALRPVTGADIRMGTKGLLRFKKASIYGPQLSWAGLSQALKATLAGDASAFAVAPAGAVQYGEYSLLANACLDYVVQVNTWAEMQQRIELGRQLAPHLQGASETWQALLCANWPIPATNPPRPFDIRGVPALVVHAVHDPSLAYAWAHGLASQIDGSHLLTRTGDGHTSYHTSPCARSAIDAYLVRPEGPANGVCRD
jgi:pimeloyl-ACP methyl ester carboxylesterase